MHLAKCSPRWAHRLDSWDTERISTHSHPPCCLRSRRGRLRGCRRSRHRPASCKRPSRFLPCRFRPDQRYTDPSRCTLRSSIRREWSRLHPSPCGHAGRAGAVSVLTARRGADCTRDRCIVCAVDAVTIEAGVRADGIVRAWRGAQPLFAIAARLRVARSAPRSSAALRGAGWGRPGGDGPARLQCEVRLRGRRDRRAD
jgi:hypothetical protein